MFFFVSLSALIVQWLGHLVVAEKTWVRFPLGAHNAERDAHLDRYKFYFGRTQDPPMLLTAAIDYFWRDRP